MHTLSIEQARDDLDSVIARVLADAEPTIVRTPEGESVVVVPLDDFEAWRETAYLLRSPANAAHLHKSIEEAEAGSVQAHGLAE